MRQRAKDAATSGSRGSERKTRQRAEVAAASGSRGSERKSRQRAEVAAVSERRGSERKTRQRAKDAAASERRGNERKSRQRAENTVPEADGDDNMQLLATNPTWTRPIQRNSGTRVNSASGLALFFRQAKLACTPTTECKDNWLPLKKTAAFERVSAENRAKIKVKSEQRKRACTIFSTSQAGLRSCKFSARTVAFRSKTRRFRAGFRRKPGKNQGKKRKAQAGLHYFSDKPSWLALPQLSARTIGFRSKKPSLSSGFPPKTGQKSGQKANSANGLALFFQQAKLACTPANLVQIQLPSVQTEAVWPDFS